MHICTYTGNIATYKIYIKFICITYEKFIFSTHESYTHEFHINEHMCIMYVLYIYLMCFKKHVLCICRIHVNFICFSCILHTYGEYIHNTCEDFHMYYAYEIYVSEFSSIWMWYFLRMKYVWNTCIINAKIFICITPMKFMCWNSQYECNIFYAWNMYEIFMCFTYVIFMSAICSPHAYVIRKLACIYKDIRTSEPFNTMDVLLHTLVSKRCISI